MLPKYIRRTRVRVSCISLFYTPFEMYKHFVKEIRHFMIETRCTQSKSCTCSKVLCTRSDLAAHALTSLHTFQPRCTRSALAAHDPTSLHTLQPRCTRSLRIFENLSNLLKRRVPPLSVQINVTATNQFLD